MKKKAIHILALGALFATGVTAQAELPLTGGFKMGVGHTTSGLREATGKQHTLIAMGELEYALNEKGSLVGELGWRYMPGAERVGSAFRDQPHWEDLADWGSSDPRYYTWAANTDYTAYNYHSKGEGFQVGLLYRHALPMDFYVQGGVRAAFNRSRVSKLGSTMHTSSTVMDNPNSEYHGLYYPVSKTAISDVCTETKLAPCFVLGGGYSFSKKYSLEVNVSNNSMESEFYGKKNGLIVDFCYRMKF